MTQPEGSKMWGGRFDRAPDASFYEFERSWEFDRRLLPQELALDRAWARAITAAGILTDEECDRLLRALDEIESRAKADPAWLDASKAEDVHHFVETALIENLGPLGAKLHTGRSRNEMVATEFRMYVKEAAREIRSAVSSLLSAIGKQARKTSAFPCPARRTCSTRSRCCFRTGCSRTAKRFSRDAERLAAAASRADACPLGSGALAGCAFPLDREALARDLGFSRITANSLDAVSDRDFALDFLFALADARDAPFAPGRGFDSLRLARIRLHRVARRIFHRQQPDAAEEKSRRLGTDPRQDGPHLRLALALCSPPARDCPRATSAICRKTRNRSSPRTIRRSPWCRSPRPRWPRRVSAKRACARRRRIRRSSPPSWPIIWSRGRSVPRGARNRGQSAARGRAGRKIDPRDAARAAEGIFAGLRRATLQPRSRSNPRWRAARSPAARRQRPFAPRSKTFNARLAAIQKESSRPMLAMNRPSLRLGYPAGFTFAATHCGLKQTRLDLGILVSDVPASAAAVFTTNQVVAAPVVASREHLRKSRGRMRGMIVNSGNANCCTRSGRLPGIGGDGRRNWRERAGRRRSLADSRLLHRRDRRAAARRKNSRRRAAARPYAQRAESAAFEDFARSIMTTDTRPKWAAAKCSASTGKQVRMLGCAKGFGDDPPQYGDDARVHRHRRGNSAGAARPRATATVGRTFNSHHRRWRHFDERHRCGSRQWPVRRAKNLECEQRRLQGLLCRARKRLQIARAGDRRRWRRRAARDRNRSARRPFRPRGRSGSARTIANSPLVKTAFAGADPNWGRILAAAGRSGVKFDFERVGHLDCGHRGLPRRPRASFRRERRARKDARRNSFPSSSICTPAPGSPASGPAISPRNTSTSTPATAPRRGFVARARPNRAPRLPVPNSTTVDCHVNLQQDASLSCWSARFSPSSRRIADCPRPRSCLFSLVGRAPARRGHKEKDREETVRGQSLVQGHGRRCSRHYLRKWACSRILLRCFAIGLRANLAASDSPKFGTTRKPKKSSQL